MTVRIRRVSQKNKLQWAALRAQLRPKAEPDQLRNEVDRTLEDANSGIFVAEHEGKMVAFIEVQLEIRLQDVKETKSDILRGDSRDSADRTYHIEVKERFSRFYRKSCSVCYSFRAA